jgi:hypothetical protein
MPGAADGLTVISAMRHLNPKAIALLLSSDDDCGRGGLTAPAGDGMAWAAASISGLWDVG